MISKIRIQRIFYALIPIAILAGILLRTLYAEDMEYKEDEEINFNASQLPLNPSLWPAAGMPTGVYLQNPGLSIWIFTILGKLIRATTPLELAHGVQWVSLLGIFLILLFTFLCLKTAKEREPWLWTFVLVLVNPIAVYYQRKLWPEPLLPPFVMLMWIGFFYRNRFWGALAWGLMGALMGQVHLSGFFLAGGFLIWSLIWDRKTIWNRATLSGWFTGSSLGALPLIPWVLTVLRSPPSHSMGLQWEQIFQFKYWVFFASNPLGLHLGNPLGLLRGNSHFSQLSDFIREPLITGQPTYLVGLAHILFLSGAAWVLYTWLKKGIHEWKSSAFWPAGVGAGVLLTLTGVNIRRYYTLIAFPFDTLAMVHAFLRLPERISRWALICLFTAQLTVSMALIHYIHKHEGAPEGDYGDAYHVVMKKRALAPVQDLTPNQPWR